MSESMGKETKQNSSKSDKKNINHIDLKYKTYISDEAYISSDIKNHYVKKTNCLIFHMGDQPSQSAKYC